MAKKTITIAFSPDSDDLFMFYAMLEKKIDLGEYDFDFKTQNTEHLNDSANSTSIDVTAISIHNYAYIADRYLMLPHGGSVGQNYGPVLIAKSPFSLSDLAGKKIAIPGLKTTAYLILKMMIPKFDASIIPISPFNLIFDALNNGDVDAGLVIHEGRMIYEQRGFHKVADIGQWWYNERQLPLPLGGNVIRRDLGTETIADVSAILRASIKYGLDNKDEVINYILSKDDRSIDELKSRSLINDYLNLYANNDTFDYGDEGRQAIQELLDTGYQKGIIPHATYVQFAP
jgi:1,4-dihydroxy-6-naphthoate synthase